MMLAAHEAEGLRAEGKMRSMIYNHKEIVKGRRTKPPPCGRVRCAWRDSEGSHVGAALVSVSG